MAEKTHSKASRTENSLRNVTCSIVAYVAKFAASFLSHGFCTELG